MPTIVLVDDHAVVREGIRRALEHGPEPCEILGEAATVADALVVIARSPPDVAIVDVVLPDGDGIQLCREIRASHPRTACLLLTSFPEPRGLLAAALAGAAAYLGKDSTATNLAETVATVAAGTTLLDPELVDELLDELSATSATDHRIGALTDQERRVFELIGQGLSNRQIGGQLHLSERTVKNYTSRLLTKLRMRRRSEVAVLAARMAEREAQQRGRLTITEPPPRR